MVGPEVSNHKRLELTDLTVTIHKSLDCAGLDPSHFRSQALLAHAGPECRRNPRRWAWPLSRP